MSAADTCIIVLNWNGAAETLACLNSLYALHERERSAIIVCDNASSDDSWEQILNWARERWPPSELGLFPENAPHPLRTYSFSLLQTGANLGFAGGMNAGLCHARAMATYRYAWLLNNDIVVTPDALNSLYECAERQPQVGLFGSTVADARRPDRVQCAGGCRYFPLLTLFRNVLAGQAVSDVMQHDGQVRLDYVYGAAMFLRMEAVDAVGFLNEEYFLFYEELDYTQRLRRAGYELAWCPFSLVYHLGSASIQRLDTEQRRRSSVANYYENLSTLKYSKNFHREHLAIIMLLRFLFKVLAVSSRGEFYLLRPLLEAYRDFWRGS